VIYVSGDSGHAWCSKRAPRSATIPKPFADDDLVVALAGPRKTESHVVGGPSHARSPRARTSVGNPTLRVPQSMLNAGSLGCGATG
jgi:hypothetical protein